jgi:WD repeat-containing protein 92
MTIEKCQIISHLYERLDYTPYDVRWIPSTPKCVVVGQTARGTGILEVFELEGGSLKSKRKVRVCRVPCRVAPRSH